MKPNTFPIVIPCIEKDIDTILTNLDCIKKYLPINTIYFIGPSGIKTRLPNNQKFIFIDEGELVDLKALKNIFQSKIEEKRISCRIGWYIQQFIKMKFSLISDADYYLLWDSDTIPVKSINLFNEHGKPYFDYKTEYHKPYFKTLEKLIPGCAKQIKESFISEHMIINSQYMRELIEEIERNSLIDGDNFMEKILYSIAPEDLCNSGFSEFETFGNFVIQNHADSYVLRKWRSMRYAGFFFPINEISDSKLKWLSKYYDAITFEKKHTLSCLSKILNRNWITHMNPQYLEYLSIPIRIKRRFCKLLSLREEFRIV